MKKIKDIFKKPAVEGGIKLSRSGVKKYFPIFAVAFLIFGVVFTTYKIVFDRPVFDKKLLMEDLAFVYETLKSIDEGCNVLSIKSDRNHIDFFTVKDFIGSEVGPLNLAHPKAWKGPYSKQNPTMQNKVYELISAKDGYYIVPGDGVKLPNGFTMGEDVKIDRSTKVMDMLKGGGKLNYQGTELAKKLDFVIGDWDFSPEKKEKLEKIDLSIKEFNAAIPYTYNSTSREVNL